MSILVRQLGMLDYRTSYQAMLTYIDERKNGPDGCVSASRGDEFWCLQHPPVYTLGKAGKREHILNAGGIDVVQTDRGGQVTYHGPGQVVVYTLLKLKDYALGPRSLVRGIETAVIQSLQAYGLSAARRDGAPGVYIQDKKIASLGLRIKNGISYHGVAVNVDLELAPFSGINPCGYAGLEVTRLIDHADEVSCETYSGVLISELLNQFETKTSQRLAS